MSEQHIIDSMNDLVFIHKTLNNLADQKTEVLKKGDMEALEALMKKEEVIVSKLRAFEQKRENAVELFLRQKNILATSITIEELLKIVSVQTRDALSKLRHDLLAEIVVLSEKNQLNQALIEQSLQFVNVSLNTMQPEAEPINYDRPDQKKSQVNHQNRQGRPLFDSKA